ncbi:hypothetical protein HPB49_023212 [Dermacentor silvarum]|uniref:Uncharacterized protein n=1 Tax=Dermacentor silvarum TaxID=543639 RepID=A0ACB8CI01_DERSI|nr:hypothetical protein HPB49_023212 [Dermacentor silvarum]
MTQRFLCSESSNKLVILGALGCLLLVGVVIFAVVGGLGGEDPAQDATNAEPIISGGSGGPPPPASPPPSTTTSAATDTVTGHGNDQPSYEPATPSPASGMPRTAEPPPQPVKEIICTLGGIAATIMKFPPDSLCDYIFYTHVFVNPNYSELQSTTGNTSFSVFVKKILSYTHTTGGLSFDIQVADPKLLQNIESTRLDLFNKKVKHYGVLNIIDEPSNLHAKVQLALEMLKKLKQMAGDDNTVRTVIAIGGLNYDDQDEFEKYQAAIHLAGARHSGASTVIAISSTNAWFGELTSCISVPPTTLTSTDTRFPGLLRNIDLVSDKVQVISDYTIGGLSIEMAAMLYTFSTNITGGLKDNAAYKSCTSATMVHLDMACETDSSNQVTIKDFNAAFANQTKSMVLLYDIPSTVRQKVKKVMPRLPRKRVAWLYFDVHFTDFLSRCGFNDPFEPIVGLRDEFYSAR